jgi:hypothetical protein
VEDVNRIECDGCGRKFNEDVFEKHAKVCKKVFQSKRKAFDSKKKRIIDSEHATILKHKEFQEKKMGLNNKVAQTKQKAQKWKKQSEELRAIVKQNRDYDNNNTGRIIFILGYGSNAKGTGYGGSGTKEKFVNVPSSISDDYSLCDMCGRKYNEQAYTRHLPTCERRTKDAMMKNKVKVATGTTGGYIGSKPNLNTRFKK